MHMPWAKDPEATCEAIQLCSTTVHYDSNQKQLNHNY